MTDKDRNRAVGLVAQGYTFKFVADEYGVFAATIISPSLWKKFTENGSSVARRPGCGPKRKLTSREDMVMVRQMKQDNTTCSHKIKQDLGLDHICLAES